MKMKRSFAVISFIIIIAGCKKKDTTDASVALQTNFTNVAYGSDPAQVMDVYLPPNRSSAETKVIVLIHGGGWSDGDKADFISYVDTLQGGFPITRSSISIIASQQEETTSSLPRKMMLSLP
jgi:hypothetical protein